MNHEKEQRRSTARFGASVAARHWNVWSRSIPLYRLSCRRRAALLADFAAWANQCGRFALPAVFLTCGQPVFYRPGGAGARWAFDHRRGCSTGLGQRPAARGLWENLRSAPALIATRVCARRNATACRGNRIRRRKCCLAARLCAVHGAQTAFWHARLDAMGRCGYPPAQEGSACLLERKAARGRKLLLLYPISLLPAMGCSAGIRA